MTCDHLAGTVGFVPSVAASAKTEGHVTVLVLGAGPAGLVLGCLLQAAGIATVVMERRSREHCVTRARAGFLAANSVRVLDENGLAAGLYRNGRSHSTCEFRGDGVRFELRYDELGRARSTLSIPSRTSSATSSTSTSTAVATSGSRRRYSPSRR